MATLTCLTCDGSGGKARGWAGQPAQDGRTCPDCHGTGIDRTPYGTGSDHCPHCGADWKREHGQDCPARQGS